VSQTVSVARATSDEAVLPERVQEVLGELVGAAKEGLLALSVEVGLGVLGALVEEEVDELVGPKGKWNPERTAVRHGRENGEVTLGGRRVQVRRPRVRTADGESELPLWAYEHFADRDPWRGSCWSGWWPASPPASTGGRRSRSASRSSPRRGRRRSRPRRACSLSGPISSCGG
jgi:hypothetical protein